MPPADSEVANNYSGKTLTYKDFWCNFVKAGDEYSVRCAGVEGTKIPDIEKKFALAQSWCWASKTSSLLNGVCASIPATLDETNENGYSVCTTTEESKVGFTTVTVFVEGWDHSMIDQKAGFRFNLGLTFEIDRI